MTAPLDLDQLFTCPANAKTIAVKHCLRRQDEKRLGLPVYAGCQRCPVGAGHRQAAVRAGVNVGECAKCGAALVAGKCEACAERTRPVLPPSGPPSQDHVWGRDRADPPLGPPPSAPASAPAVGLAARAEPAPRVKRERVAWALELVREEPAPAAPSPPMSSSAAGDEPGVGGSFPVRVHDREERLPSGAPLPTIPSDVRVMNADPKELAEAIRKATADRWHPFAIHGHSDEAMALARRVGQALLGERGDAVAEKRLCRCGCGRELRKDNESGFSGYCNAAKSASGEMPRRSRAIGARASDSVQGLLTMRAQHLAAIEVIDGKLRAIRANIEAGLRAAPAAG